MSMNNVVLLLGTNLFEKEKNLKKAEALLNARAGKLINHSQTIETEPIGFSSKNVFLNKTVTLETDYSPIKLLELIKQIEWDMGRRYTEAKEGYQDRIIDIDILMFNNIIFKSKNLTIPHHQIKTRKFVNFLLNYSCNK